MGAAKGPEGQLVMLVDDDRDIRQLVRTALEDSGFAVVEAGDGVEALNRVTDQRPRLIVLDVNMPRMDGFQFLEAYHALPAPHAPVLLFTAEPDAGERAKGVRVDGIIAKPFDLDDLLSAVRHHAAADRVPAEVRPTRRHKRLVQPPGDPPPAGGGTSGSSPTVPGGAG